MERGGVLERFCRKMHPICNCFSVALKQATEAEIDIPARRRFRLIFASGDTSFGLPEDADVSLGKVAARSKIGLRALLDCLNDVKIQAGLRISDGLTRTSGRKAVE